MIVIDANTLSKLTTMDAEQLSKALINTGYDGLSSNATASFAGINSDGDFVYKVTDNDTNFIGDEDEEIITFKLYVSFDRETEEIAVEF